jgi:hypothetical protein
MPPHMEASVEGPPAGTLSTEKGLGNTHGAFV